MIMKKKILVLMLSVWLFNGCVAQSQDEIKLYYINSQDQKIFLDRKSFYDIEEKPVIYHIDNIDSQAIYIIELFRIIDLERHFYKSYSLSYSEIKSGFEVRGLFTDVTSPFIIPSGIIIKICKTDKQHYLKLKNREQCTLLVEFKILKSK